MKIPDLLGAIEKRDAAYEIKFVVSVDLAEAALAWARSNLEPDPHSESADGDGYHVNSLYFDTASLDVYQRKGSYGKAKYRIRRYGSEESLFLERKLKSRGLVSKRRTRVADEELGLLTADPEPEWIGYWFCRRLRARQLLPKCQIAYQRVARLGMTAAGPIRFTVDRDIRAVQSSGYGVTESGNWMELLPDRCILELKFRLGMPPLFKAFTEQLALTPQPMSKYRLSVQAFGLAPVPVQNGPVPNGHVSPSEVLNQLPLLEVERPAPAREA